MTKLLMIMLLSIPLLEIYIFIHMGNIMGALPTVALVILTTVIGILLLSYQNLQTALRARSKLVHGDFPIREVLESMIFLISGSLLLAPGFCTDCMGFLLLIPKFRIVITSNYLTKYIKDMKGHTIDHSYMVADEHCNRDTQKQTYH